MIIKALLLILAALPFCSFGKDYDVGYLYKVEIGSVRVTQSSVGFKEVDLKLDEIAERDEDDVLAAYKQKKAGKAVVGPNDVLYLVDGHHFARALHKYGSSNMWVEILHDFSDLSSAEFWAKMKQKKLVYLKDQHGNDITPSELPKTVAGLKNDPYRSLAYFVRKCAGYKELKTPFQEFRWAEFFREHIHLPANPSAARWQSALDEALKLCRTDQASHLPGYTGRRASCETMLGWLDD